MDLNFFRRAERALASSEPARFDYGVLTAALGVAQSAGARAALQPPLDEHPLVELLSGGPRWREAVRLQGGRFQQSMLSGN